MAKREPDPTDKMLDELLSIYINLGITVENDIVQQKKRHIVLQKSGFDAAAARNVEPLGLLPQFFPGFFQLLQLACLLALDEVVQVHMVFHLQGEQSQSFTHSHDCSSGIIPSPCFIQYSLLLYRV